MTIVALVVVVGAAPADKSRKKRSQTTEKELVELLVSDVHKSRDIMIVVSTGRSVAKWVRGCDAPPKKKITQKVHFFATKWAQNEVL